MADEWPGTPVETAQWPGRLVNPQAPSALSDIGSGIISGAEELPSRLVGTPGDLVTLARRGANWLGTAPPPPLTGPGGFPIARTPPTTRETERRLEPMTGELYQPRTGLGQEAKELTATLTDPWTYIGGGVNLARKAIGGIAATLGSQAAGKLTEGTEFEPAARLIGGIAGGTAAGGRAAAATERNRTAVPTREELEESVPERYRAVEDLNVPLQGDVIKALGERIKDDLSGRGNRFYREDQPRTFSHLDRLSRPGAAPGSADVVAVRTALDHVVKDNRGKSEGLAAQRAIDMIDDYLGNIPQLGEAMRAARGDYRALKQSERNEQIIERAINRRGATGVGANLNTLRQEARRVLENKKFPPTAAEADVLRAVVRGDNPTNIARLFSRLGPQHPFMGWGAALAESAATGGHNFLPLMTLGFGQLMQYVEHRGTLGRLEDLDEFTRAMSPLARERGVVAAPPSTSGYATAGRIARDVATGLAARAPGAARGAAVAAPMAVDVLGPNPNDALAR